MTGKFFSLRYSFILFLVACSSNVDKQSIDEKVTYEDSIAQQLILDQQADRNLENGAYDREFTLLSGDMEVAGKLYLSYIMDWTFHFVVSKTNCKIEMSDQFTMTSSYQGTYRNENCLLHFYFKGYQGEKGWVVEIEQQGSCFQEDDCSLSGIYTAASNAE